MTAYHLDDIDTALLTRLQEQARISATDLAATIGVSDNTIHNRINRLEDADVITGYTTLIDHDRTGLNLYFHFSCTTRISERTTVAEEAKTIPQVLEVTELMTGQENLHIKAVAAVDEDITHIAEQLDSLDLEINDENLIRAEHTTPLDYNAVKMSADTE